MRKTLFEVFYTEGYQIRCPEFYAANLRGASEGLSHDVDSRTFATASKKAAEGSGTDEMLATSDRHHSDCVSWFSGKCLKEQLKQEVERELKAKETEPWEIIYFKRLSEPNAGH